MTELTRKQPWLAVFLSTLIPGAGQIYGGRKNKGLVIIGLGLSCWLISAVSFGSFIFLNDQKLSLWSLPVAAISVLILTGVSLWSLFDAHKVARIFNEEHRLPEEPGVKKKPWLAVFLSHLYPGLGQFYNRQILKGSAFIIVGIILSLAAHKFVVLSIFLAGLYLFTIKDAFDSAEKLNGTSAKFLDQGTSAARALVAFIIISSCIPYGPIIKANIVQAFKIPGGSMIPSFLIGDHILVNRTPGAKASVRRGDIVVFIYPEDRKRDFVKRIVGTPGDKLEIRDKVIYINDAPTQESYIQYVDNAIHSRAVDPRDNFGPIEIPEDKFFVMGDNRDQSYDSRFWGFVPRESIKGRAIKIYWSWDHVSNKVRWERIGMAVH